MAHVKEATTSMRNLILSFKKRGCVQSAHDPCVLCNKCIIVLCCVDDCLFFTESRRLSNELSASLKEVFHCTDKGEEDGFLGDEIRVIDKK